MLLPPFNIKLIAMPVLSTYLTTVTVLVATLVYVEVTMDVLATVVIDVVGIVVVVTMGIISLASSKQHL